MTHNGEAQPVPTLSLSPMTHNGEADGIGHSGELDHLQALLGSARPGCKQMAVAVGGRQQQAGLQTSGSGRGWQAEAGWAANRKVAVAQIHRTQCLSLAFTYGSLSQLARQLQQQKTTCMHLVNYFVHKKRIL